MMKRPQCYAIAIALALVLAAPCRASGDAPPENADCVSPEPTGYRMSRFRAPTPCRLSGATVLATDTLVRLIADANPVLIDVLPAQRRPAQWASDALWLPPPRSNIPGSVWLPNTGLGLLPVEEERYLRENLERLTAGKRARAVVFYCESACWMSWNAARRAVQWGYRSVYWYPGGTDAWLAAGHAVAASQPVPRKADQ